MSGLDLCRKWCGLIFLFGIIFSFGSGDSTLSAAGPKANLVIEGNTSFALDLYSRLRKQSGNIFFSPYSISSALAMTYAGAGGETKEQMAKALHFGADQASVHQSFAGLISYINSLQKQRGIELSTANSLWADKNYKFLGEFIKLVKRSYQAQVKQVDFQGASESARREINAWVEGQTKDKIKDLIGPGILDSMTRLVLTNAIYFKGSWDKQFKKSQTKDAPFFLESGGKRSVPMMHQTRKYSYMENNSLQILELPYSGEKLSMLVLLPKEKDGLMQLERKLTAEKLRRWRANLEERKVKVYLPRFTLTSQFKLNQELMALGVKLAFSMDADFSGMDGSKKLYLSAVLHKAFVDVNEEGSEAAAATAAVMQFKSLPLADLKMPVFRADHPFLFMIRETQTGSILFMGRLLNPGGERSLFGRHGG